METTLKAGRELDALVAEKVMGWTFRPYGNGGGEWTVNGKKMEFGGFEGGSLPYYSTSIAGAWEIVEKVLQHPCRTFGIIVDEATDTWIVKMDKIRCVFNDCRITEQNEELPLAICLAALKAVDGQ